MNIIKSYITQLLKTSFLRLKLQDEVKTKTINQIISRLENCDEILPELKQMENVLGLEDVAAKLIAIYRRLSKNHIDFDRISLQYSDDKDAMISSLRRYIQNSEPRKTFGSATRKTKYVFDDTTSTFYEVKDDVEAPQIEMQNQENKISVSEYLSINEPSPDQKEESDKEVEIKAEFHKEKKEETEAEAEIPLKFDEIGFNKTIVDENKSILKEPEPPEQFPKVDKLDTVEYTFKVPQNEDLSARANPEISSTKIEKLTNENHNNEIKKSFEDEYLEFETRLMNNIRLVDEYLFKFMARIINPEFEQSLIDEAESLYNMAQKFGHDVIARLIKSYWYALLAIKDKKLPSTKNEAEIIRSTLIIIVATIKNKEIDLSAYWSNHQILISKLSDFSLEV